MQYNITYREKDKGIQFIISYKLNGKWKQKSKQGFKSKKEAKKVADKTLNLLKQDLNDNTKIFKYKAIFLLAGTCGLRLGEILGLTWDCINFQNNILIINKQFKNLPNGECGFGALKSKNSYRSVPMPQSTILVLKEYKRKAVTDVNNRLFLYKSVQATSGMLKRYLTKLGFNISLHELRHTYATTLISNGVDFKTAAQLPGHDIEQTMKTYSYVNDDMILHATMLIEKIFQKNF